MDGITFQKLRDIEARFAAVEAAMADPAVAQDPAAYQKLARESKESRPVVERFRAYKDALQELAKVQEMARAEEDPELREMAHEEARALEARRDSLDAEIPSSSSRRTRTTRRTCSYAAWQEQARARLGRWSGVAALVFLLSGVGGIFEPAVGTYGAAAGLGWFALKAASLAASRRL